MNKLCLDNNIYVCFDANNVFVKDLRSNEDIADGRVEGSLYKLDLNNQPQIFNCENASMETWHNRLDHICEQKNKRDG